MGVGLGVGVGVGVELRGATLALRSGQVGLLLTNVLTSELTFVLRSGQVGLGEFR